MKVRWFHCPAAAMPCVFSPSKFLRAILFANAVLVSSLTCAAETLKETECQPQTRECCGRPPLIDDEEKTRQWLAKHGFELEARYNSEVMANTCGGSRRRAVYRGLLSLAADLDFDKILGEANGASFHAGSYWFHGDNFSQKFIGSLGAASNIDAPNGIRLAELWYQQNWLADQISLRLGQLQVDSEFFASEFSSLYLNGGFGAFPLLSANLINPPIYPMSATGARLLVKPLEFFDVKLGIFNGDTLSPDQNPGSTRFRFASGEGVLLFSEISISTATAKIPLPGTYKFGGFFHSRDVDTWDSRVADAAGTGALQGKEGDFGFYGVVDQWLWRASKLLEEDARGIAVFVRPGWAPPSVNAVDFYGDAGVNFVGLLPSRHKDIVGFAASHSSLSCGAHDFSVAVDGPALGAETVFEITWRIFLAEWWSLQPDFQYIVHPGGVRGAEDAIIFAVRNSISF